MKSGTRIRKFLLAIALGLATLAHGAEGDPVTLTGVQTDGTPFDLAQHRGKVVMVNFWATWCPACRADWPVWQETFERYRNSDFEMVAVSIDRSEGDLEKFIKKHPYTVPIVWRFDSREKDSFPAIRKTPTTYFIDREGNVTERRLGRISKADLIATIEEMLQQ
jgi:thiol-disulfide isomerase/thioredoxin